MASLMTPQQRNNSAGATPATNVILERDGAPTMYIVVRFNDYAQAVSSRSVAGAWHLVRAGECDCTWAVTHPDTSCAHLDAVEVAATAAATSALWAVRSFDGDDRLRVMVPAEGAHRGHRLTAMLWPGREAVHCSCGAHYEHNGTQSDGDATLAIERYVAPERSGPEVVQQPRRAWAGEERIL